MKSLLKRSLFCLFTIAHQSTSGLAFSTLSSSQSALSQEFSLLHELVAGNVAWNSLVGEADRAFRLGVLLEKNGQARKASASFHEAATLYQCFVDRKSEFGHVTCLPEEDCTTILAYTCLRLAFLNLDALGDPKAAAKLYKESASIDPIPSAVSYTGLGNSIQADGSVEKAIPPYRSALQIQPADRNVLFHLAVALERSGEEHEAEEIMEILRREESKYACLVDSWGYVRWHTRKTEPLNLYRGTRSMLELALKAALPLVEQGGLVCEFGVGSGRSMRFTQEILPLTTELHGFDTFTGLPQPWGNEPAGSYSTGGRVPVMDGKVQFHKGLFGETITPFLKERGPEAFLAYANIDCDLYSSTLDILEAMHGRVVPGTIIVFDEYIGHPSWRQDEFRAWRETCKRFGWKYEYLAFSLTTNQAIVRITEA
ncbi:hypothetical protein FisN_13Lh125 [Fistulifera solaris]|uniref:Uncharacterized protein n=1 Tax=Fistulifera solaris TaxID=1519565 RepID=A0A1Z5JF72_FISSO|nr:hypothetical protein FisN_13Lh125 [Fistulifera solaris]|eukprot:GAX12654.1 hypothetical protein FisN_13Lh125 [Fistulifera solaris]